MKSNATRASTNAKECLKVRGQRLGGYRGYTQARPTGRLRPRSRLRQARGSRRDVHRNVGRLGRLLGGLPPGPLVAKGDGTLAGGVDRQAALCAAPAEAIGFVRDAVAVPVAIVRGARSTARVAQLDVE